MSNVLIVYASTHGQTAKIAARVAERMRVTGIDVDLHNVSVGNGATSIAADAVIVMGSIHREKHQRELVDWVKQHRISLADLPTAFVSVSLTAAEDTDEARDTTRRLIDEFFAETRWTPSRSIPVAGALQYREYDFFTRTLMRLLMKRMGHPTDTSHDYDYTDWDGVDRMADDFAASLPRSRSAHLIG